MCTFQVRDTDLDALERVVTAVAFGDVDAEGPPGAVADVSQRKLLRLSQLANEYLLHVQDHLASQNGVLKVPSISAYGAAMMLGCGVKWSNATGTGCT